jgi:16S rRNA (cytosine967-C5)-methyltransferase
MPDTPPIRPFQVAAIAELYRQITASPHPADREMDAFFRRHPKLGKRDRRLVAETVYGMLRHRRWLEWAFPPADAPTQVLCYLAAFAPETPLPVDPADRARLEAAVAAARAKPLPNAPAEALGLRSSLPDWMAQAWLDAYGPDEAGALCASLNQAAPLTLRVNTLKVTRDQLQQQLLAEGHATDPTPFSPDGLLVREKANLFSTEAFRAGHFEVQDEGSQLLSRLVAAAAGQRVVDGCAGAGGKTLHLAAQMQNKGMLYAFDVSARRLDELRLRVRRAGVSNVRVHLLAHNHTRDIKRLYGQADAVLLDAPCSGSGVLRRNPDAAWKITPARVAALTTEQHALLNAYAPLVQPGGRLVYATCSLFPAENEQVVHAFLAHHPDFHLASAAEVLARQGIALPHQTDAFLRLSPHRHGTDGFFAAVLVQQDAGQNAG